jgi:serine/threonine-protein phosphatase 6 regulatory ankyrin repeat subunit B
MFKPVYLLVVLAIWSATPGSAMAEPIHDAVKAADLVKLQQLLDAGAEVDARDEQGYTPLHWAVDQGVLEISHLLIEHQADVSSQANNGDTPLHVAGGKGRSKAIVLLLESGAEIDKLNNSELTPLHLAIQEGRIATVEVLLDNGASTSNVSDYEVRDALYFAIAAGKTEIVALLIKRGANVSMEHLHPAICAHNLKVVQSLYEPRNEEEEIAIGADVLATAAMCGDRPTLEFLMNSAGYFDYGSVANHLSQSISDIQPPNLELVKLLFAKDPNIKEHATGMLQGLIYRGCSADFLAYLLDRGADVENIVKASIVSNSMLPYRHPEMLKLFLAHGAKIDIVTEWGNTALMLAAPENNLAAVQYLAKHGANVNIANELGNTALHLAAARNLTEIAAVLIKNGAKVNVANADGNTPLHQAVRFTSQFDTARLLLANGANIKACNTMELTALHYAATRGSDMASEMEMAGGGEVMEWQRPYEQAAESNALMELIQYLVKNGAEVRAKDAKGRYPIDLARLNVNHPNIAAYLEAQMKNARH